MGPRGLSDHRHRLLHSCLLVATEQRYVIGTDPLRSIPLCAAISWPPILSSRAADPVPWTVSRSPLRPKRWFWAFPELRVRASFLAQPTAHRPQVTFFVKDGGSGMLPLYLYRESELPR